MLWVGTRNGLNKFSPFSQQFGYITHTPGLTNTLSDDIEAVVEGPPGTLWLSYDQDGFSKFETRTETFTHYLPDSTASNSLPLGRIQRSLHYDTRRNLHWLGLDGGGLVAFDPLRETFTAYQPNPNNANSLSSNRIKHIFQDNSGAIWAGTVSPELNRLNPETGQITRTATTQTSPMPVRIRRQTSALN